MSPSLVELIREYMNTEDPAESLRLLDLINTQLVREGKLYD